MEHKQFKFALKDLNQAEGVFTGYAAVFGNKDLGGDIVEAGAFAKTLKDHQGKVHLLDYHDHTKRIGVAYVAEDAKGLKVERGVLNMEKQAGKDMLADLRFYKEHGLPLEMSIGYDAVTKDVIDNVRHLKEIALWETSIVTWGMNPKAKVGAVKADDETAQRLTALEEQNTVLVGRLAELESKAEATPAEPATTDTPDEPVNDHLSEEEAKALLTKLRETRALFATLGR